MSTTDTGPTDQAAGLRRLMARPQPRVLHWLDPAGDADGVLSALADALAGQHAACLVLTADGGATRHPGGRLSPQAARAVRAAPDAASLAGVAGADLRIVLAVTLGTGATAGVPAASECVIVMTIGGQGGLAAGLTDTYAILKRVQRSDGMTRCAILVRGGNAGSTQAAYARLESVSSRFLGLELRLLGGLSPPPAQGRADPRGLRDVARSLLG